MTIRPDKALASSGILSTVIENTSGKILAKPRPTTKNPATATDSSGQNNPSKPRIESRQVMRKKTLGLIQLRKTPPEKRPMVSAAKKSRAQQAGLGDVNAEPVF